MGMGMGMGEEEEEEEEEDHDAGSRTRPAGSPALPRQGAVRARRAPIRGHPYHHLTYRRARTRASNTYHPHRNMW